MSIADAIRSRAVAGNPLPWLVPSARYTKRLWAVGTSADELLDCGRAPIFG